MAPFLLAGRSIGASTAGTANRTCNPVLPAACSAPPPPYSWPALRTRLLRLAGHVSYALLDEPNLWSDGELLQGVFQLLRALGAHRHSQELQPLLHAYVGLVADRIAAEPSELACLDCLWDAVGLQCIASLPQVGHTLAAGEALTRYYLLNRLHVYPVGGPATHWFRSWPPRRS